MRGTGKKRELAWMLVVLTPREAEDKEAERVVGRTDDEIHLTMLFEKHVLHPDRSVSQKPGEQRPSWR